MTSLLAALLFAADFNGIWAGTIQLPNGRTEDVTFQLTQKGALLTGKQYDDMESTPILKGTISGELITFTLVRQEQMGNEILRNHTRYTGRLIGDEIELTRERESTTRSASGATDVVRNNIRHTFKLKRLK
jgi:hypothetical protein